MGSLMEIRRQMMSADNELSLPSEYQRVAYVDNSAGDARLDTGVNGNNQNLRFKFCAEAIDAVQYGAIFGNFKNGQENNWRMIWMSTGGKGFYLSAGNKAADLMRVTFPSSVVGEKLYVDMKYQDISVVVDHKKYKHNPVTFTSGTNRDENISIGSGAATTTASGHFKYYYFKIYDNGTLIRNYIPCIRKSDSKVGFYDSVNKNFSYSSGNKQFTAPS